MKRCSVTARVPCRTGSGKHDRPRAERFTVQPPYMPNRACAPAGCGACNDFVQLHDAPSPPRPAASGAASAPFKTSRALIVFSAENGDFSHIRAVRQQLRPAVCRERRVHQPRSFVKPVAAVEHGADQLQPLALRAENEAPSRRAREARLDARRAGIACAAARLFASARA